MGLFDTVYVHCPKCGESDAEFQTKAGQCMMAAYIYGRDEIPPEIALDLNGQSETCYHCGVLITFRARVTTEVWIDA